MKTYLTALVLILAIVSSGNLFTMLAIGTPLWFIFFLIARKG